MVIRGVLLSVALAFAGCGSAGTDPDHPDVVAVAPRLAPPPARDGALEERAGVERLEVRRMTLREIYFEVLAGKEEVHA